MGELPEFVKSGEAARLFPILADTSKEGRTLSIFLACFENVAGLGRSLLGTLNMRLGSRTRIDTYTEIVLIKASNEQKLRPDGLIVVNTGRSTWAALVEAKVGAAELTNAQIEAYLALAKLNGIDAVITLSNQFTPLATHHPLSVNATLTRKVALYHWSWGDVITRCQLLRESGEVDDREQLILLSELQRFLLHPSSGVKEFDQMPAAWSDLCEGVAAGVTLTSRDGRLQDVVGSWHQALDRMATVLSRQVGRPVRVSISRSEASDPADRLGKATTSLVADLCLASEIIMPNTAGNMRISADFRKRVVTCSMRVNAPGDRKSTKARLAWLLRQLGDTETKDMHVRLSWPGRAASSQHPLATLIENPDIAVLDRQHLTVTAFEILLVRELGGKFAQRRIIVPELIKTVSTFHANVGARISAWQAKPPKIADGKLEPASVSTEALHDQLEKEALQRTE